MEEVLAVEPYVPIESANAEAWKRLLRKWWLYIPFLIAGALIVVALPGNIISSLIVFPIIVFGLFMFVRDGVLRDFMKHFAAANNYRFLPEGDNEMVGDLKGTLFRKGYEGQMSNVVSGLYLSFHLRIFNYRYWVGKNTTTNTVFELKLNTNLPNIFLMSSGHYKPFGIRSSDDNLLFSSHPKKMHIGGGYDDSFALYAPEDYEAEALQIFDSTTMQIISHSFKDIFSFAIEMVEDRLNIYVNGQVAERKELKALYEMAKAVAERIGPVVERMKPLLTVQKEVFSRLNQVS